MENATSAASTDNCIRMRIEKYSQVTPDGVWSAKKHCMGFPWKICTRRKTSLELTLYAFKDEESNIWFCDVSMECTLINQNEGGENYKLPPIAPIRFTHDNCETVGLAIVLDKPNLLEKPELGFLKDDIIIVEACIIVSGSPGNRFRNKIAYNMFAPSHTSDGVLVVGGKRIYVSKQLLAIQSPFFDRIFFGTFKEATQPEALIKDVVLDEFMVLLKIVYGTGETFSAKNIEFILKLADRFEMMGVLDGAEKFLLSSALDIHMKFRLSDQYNLCVLQDQLLPMYTADMIRALKKSPNYEILKDETKDLLFDKYLEFTTPKSK